MKIILTLLLSSSSLAFADTIKLINGTVLEGKTVEIKDDKIIFSTFAGKINIPKADVIDLKSTNPKIKLGERSQTLQTLKNMIQKRKHFNKKDREKMQKLSASLLLGTRKNLYFYYHKRFVILYSGLGIIPGLGSWLQGDVFNAVFSESLVIGGMIISQIASLHASKEIQSIGGILALIGWLSSVIAPFAYQKKYNRLLQDSLQPTLNLESKAGYQIAVWTLRF